MSRLRFAQQSLFVYLLLSHERDSISQDSFLPLNGLETAAEIHPYVSTIQQWKRMHVEYTAPSGYYIYLYDPPPFSYPE